MTREPGRWTVSRHSLETRTSPTEVKRTWVTGPRWWSILFATWPVLNDVTIMRLSSPPLTTNLLFNALVTDKTDAICSLSKNKNKNKNTRPGKIRRNSKQNENFEDPLSMKNFAQFWSNSRCGFACKFFEQSHSVQTSRSRTCPNCCLPARVPDFPSSLRW